MHYVFEVIGHLQVVSCFLFQEKGDCYFQATCTCMHFAFNTGKVKVYSIHADIDMSYDTFLNETPLLTL